MLPLSMLAMAATSVGQTFGISTFNSPIRDSLSLSHTQLASAYMLGTILGSLPITYFGHFMDRFGLRNAMLGVLTMLAGACVVLSLASSWFMLLGAFFLLRMLGPGTLSMLSGNILPFWFEKRLGFVDAIRKTSISIAMGGVPALNLWLLTFLEWRQVYLFWGALLLFGVVPIFLMLFRSRPEDVGQVIDHGDPNKVKTDVSQVGLSLNQAMNTFAFWAIATGGMLYALVATGVVFNLTPILIERGLTEWDHARVMGALAICMATTQFASGILSDHINPKPLMLAAHAACIAAMIMFLQTTNSATALVAGGLMGVAQGLFFGVTHPLWARRFGRLHLGKITGFAMTTMVAASSGGPFLMGIIKDWQGSFGPSLLLFSLLPIPIAVVTQMAKLPSPGLQILIESE